MGPFPSSRRWAPFRRKPTKRFRNFGPSPWRTVRRPPSRWLMDHPREKRRPMMGMERAKAVVRNVKTPSGQISYAEAGSGPVALFVHGVLLSKHLWRHQIAGLPDTRRCIAVDLLAHGDTEITPGQDVSVTTNAHMPQDLRSR